MVKEQTENQLREKFSTLDHYYQQRKEKWNSNVLKTILPFSVFRTCNRCTPRASSINPPKEEIEIDDNELKEELQKVSGDLILEDDGTCKIRFRLFAEFVLSKMAESEKRKVLLSIGTLFISFNESFTDVVSTFFSAWP